MGVKERSKEEIFFDKQIGRLKGFPRWEGFREELVKMLWRHSFSEDHAERVIDEIIETRLPNGEGFVSCPTPGEMLEYCRAVPEQAPEKTGTASANCPRCGGTGFVHTKRRARALPGMPEQDYDYSAVCSCRAKAGAA